MGLFSWLRGEDLSQKAIAATPAVLETMAARQFSPYVALGGTNLNAQRVGQAFVKVQAGSYSWLYLYSPPVRRVVDYISRNVSQLGLKCYERVSDDEREHRGDHAAAEALRHPNPQTPGNYFIQEFVKCHLVYGNAYALKFRPTPRSPLALVILNPAMVGIVGRSHFSADAYRVYSADGTFFDVPPEDMLRWPATTGDDPRCGESPLETLRESLAADVAAQAAVTGLHRSGLVFSGWIERDIEAPEWSEQARQRFQESWTNQGRDSQKHTPVLEEGMKFKQAGVTPEDAQFIASRERTFDEVASLFGMKDIPPESEDARRQFYADVLPPLCELLASFLDLHVLQQEYGEDDYYFEFNLDEKLITDDRIKTLISAAGAPIYTRNESRAVLNKPPLPGGDELITPSNLMVGEHPLPSQGVMPIQDPNKPPQDGSHRRDDAPVPAGRASLNGQNGHHKAHLIPRQAHIDHSRNIYAGKYGSVYADHFARQRRSIVAKGLSKSLAVKALEDKRWDKELAADTRKVSQRHFNTAGDAYAFRIASGFDPDYGQNWLTSKAKESAEAVNKTTREHVEELGVTEAFALAATRAVAAGKGYATDVHGFASKVALEQDPNRAVRSVTITGGECEVCAEFQGTFPVDEVPAWPGYHAGCQCFADIDGGGKALEPVKSEALELLTKTLEKRDEEFRQMMGLFKAMVDRPSPPAPNVAISPAEVNFAEGAINPVTNIEAPPPAEVTIAKGAVQAPVNVAPAEVTIEKGAVQMDAPPPAEVRIAEGAVQVPVSVAPSEFTMQKGAIQIDAPPPAELHFDEGAMKNEIVVEAAKPADVNFQEGAFKFEPTEVNVHPPNVNVAASPPPELKLEEGAIKVEPAEVNVTPEVKVDVNIPKEGKRKITRDSKGRVDGSEPEED